MMPCHDARNVGGVVGVAMNSVLLVHEHPEEPASNWHVFSYSKKHVDSGGFHNEP